MMQDISTTLKGRIGSDPSMKKVKRGDNLRLAPAGVSRYADARTGNASYVEDGTYCFGETWGDAWPKCL